MKKSAAKQYTVKDLLGAVDATHDYVVAIRKLLRGLPPSTPLNPPRGASGSGTVKLRIRNSCPPPK